MNHRLAFIMLLGLLAAWQGPQAIPSVGVITGRVVTEEGDPIAHTAITVVHSGGMMRVGSTTDESGSFRISIYAAGSCRLEVTPPPGYIQAPESGAGRFYQSGDDVTIRLVKGGVITGRVTSANGEPVIAVRVSAVPARTMDTLAPDTPRPSSSRPGSERLTDERGVYRLFGLEPGSYLIVANGQTAQTSDSSFIFNHDAPVYHPSSSAATARPVTVKVGEEASGIDIRYRSQPGHAITGRVVAAADSGNAERHQITVALSAASSGVIAALSQASGPRAEGHDFNFDHVTDGEYELTARSNQGNLVSAPLRVTMKGADLTGLQLKLLPRGFITGRVILDAASPANRPPACAGQRRALLEEIMLSARRDELGRDESPTTRRHEKDSGEAFAALITPLGPTASTEAYFMLRYLEPGRYRMLTRLPSEDWYVRAIRQPAVALNQSLRDAARDGLTLKPNARPKELIVAVTQSPDGLRSQIATDDPANELTITLATGASGLRGQVIAAQDATLSSPLRVHLIPAEREQAENVLRYAETLARSDGSFTFAHLAPGKYWLLAQAVSAEEANQTASRLMAWDSNERAKLRREAEAAKAEIELQPCQRVSDYALRYTPQGK